MQDNCSECIDEAPAPKKGIASVLSALLIVVIPKCPWCIMAYSSAIAMCGGDPIYRAHNNWISYIPLMLAGVILFMLARKRKGWRTYASITVAVAGSILILGTHQTWLPNYAYQIGSILLFAAIWLNGNLLAFIRTCKAMIRQAKLKWQQ